MRKVITTALDTSHSLLHLNSLIIDSPQAPSVLVGRHIVNIQLVPISPGEQKEAK